MLTPRKLWPTLLVVAGAGLMSINGCLARAERNLDILLAPEALQNALVAPYSPMEGLVERFVRLVRG